MLDNGALTQALTMTTPAGNPSRITYTISGGHTWWAGQWPDGGFYIADGTTSANRIVISQAGALTINTTSVGFFNTTPVAKPTVTGSKGANAALASLLTALAAYGLVTDSTT